MSTTNGDEDPPKPKRTRRPKWQTNPLWPRRDDVTDWSIRRVDGDGSETRLWWGDSNHPSGISVRCSEFDMRELTVANVLARWGPGWYRLYFTGNDTTGRRRPRGRSKIIGISDMQNAPIPGKPPPGLGQ